jgi:pectin methylesterase-like acyl-CoA thioesterase
LLLPAIWIVDAQMGPGAQFADLPAAIAAAANGDTILVRAGTYSGFSVNGKALTLRGEGMATTRILASALGMTVEILNAGGVFVLSGLRLEGGLPAMIVQSSAVELLD